MGKKEKELSMAILAESSSPATEIQSPRKRGRPRKILPKDEETSKKMKASEAEDGEETKAEKEKYLEDINEQVEGSSSKLEKEGGKSEKDEELSMQPQVPRRSSRARRKSKPRKTS